MTTPPGEIRTEFFSGFDWEASMNPELDSPSKAMIAAVNGGAAAAPGPGALHASAGIPIVAMLAHASHGKYFLLKPNASPLGQAVLRTGRTVLARKAQVNDFCAVQLQNNSPGS